MAVDTESGVQTKHRSLKPPCTVVDQTMLCPERQASETMTNAIGITKIACFNQEF